VDDVPVGLGIRRGGGAVGVERPELLAADTQLLVQVLPLAHAQIVQVLALAHAAKSAARQRPLLVLEIAPQVCIGAEVAAGRLEAGVRLIRLGLLIARPLAWVLDGEGRDDDEHLLGASEVGGEEHAAQAWVDRQPVRASGRSG
jgi:hypothetical protein